MNLDNYFARYLSKRAVDSTYKLAATAREVDEEGRPSRSKLSEGTPSRVSTASSLGAAEQPPSCNAAQAHHVHASGHTQRTHGFMVDHSHTPFQSQDCLVSMEYLKSGEASISADAGQKRPRDVEAPPTVSSGPTACRLRTSRDDDEDQELDLLLGVDEAQRVKEMDAAFRDEQKSRGTNALLARRAVEGSTAHFINTLPWGTHSNRKREELAHYFESQFEYELQCSDNLLDCYEPFFRDRALRLIRERRDRCAVLHPAPTITASIANASHGCALRGYQVEGVQFMLNNFHRGMSCILSDDMGLGKTAQVASFFHTLKAVNRVEGPHLIIAPLSTMTSWTRELSRWAPELKVVKYHGERRARQQTRNSHHHLHAVFVTTPAILTQDRGFFRKRTWVTVAVDEAHVLKGHDTMITTIARKLTACFRIAVTGTPVHNNVREVWNLMGFLYPNYTARYDTSDDDPVNSAEECARLLRHIMLRRTKHSMELGIPPRVDEPVSMLTPTYVQHQLLSRLAAHALQDAEEGTRRLQMHLSHQRVVCNHPLALRLLAAQDRFGSNTSFEERLRVAGVTIDEASLIQPSAKMLFLDGLLKRMKEEGHRCLIFSNFTSTLDILQGMCVLRGYSYERLDGTCNRVERELSILRYNAPNSTCFLFLITTTAGGVGVTLTGADTVILFDAHFNPQLDRQAADRAHRIGQTRTVHVYRLCIQRTVEEHIRNIADQKASLGDFIVEGGSHGPDRGKGVEDNLSSEHIRRLLGQYSDAQRVKESHTGDDMTAAEDTAPLVSAPFFDRCTQETMIEELMEVELHGLPGPVVAADGRRNGCGLNGGFETTHHCFVCGDIMHPLEPLYHCAVCPKAYHAGCVGEKVPVAGVKTNLRHWTCPRHMCSTCEKPQAADGALFMCVRCPCSFCFDCLDPRYLELDDSGTQLAHISRRYDEMETEHRGETRSCYYITCLRCCGILSSSSSASESGSESDDENECTDTEEAVS